VKNAYGDVNKKKGQYKSVVYSFFNYYVNVFMTDSTPLLATPVRIYYGTDTVRSGSHLFREATGSVVDRSGYAFNLVSWIQIQEGQNDP